MNLLKNNFSILSLCMLVLGLIVIIFFPKGFLELEINQYWTTPHLDMFFKYATYLGDGWILALLLVVFLFVKFRYSLMVVYLAVVQTILVHLNKRLLFEGLPRPKIFFQDANLHFVDGVTVNSFNTFPSGHTATAFSIFFLLSVLIKGKGWSVVFFLLALMVAFSRVYLLQHFIIDIYFGAIIGYASGFLAILIDKKSGSNRLLDRRISI